MDIIQKRIFDVIFSLLGILTLFPLMLIIALLIKVYMPGSVFFKQERIGRLGQSFVIIKFRTMVLNSDNNTISVQGDQRITKLGAKLRRYKLDELPELFNILLGDMSFVGPRPDMPDYLARLKGDERKILELRPGLTGLATLKYANEEELLAQQSDPRMYNDEVIWPDKVRLNLHYYEHRNLFMDLRIICQTLLQFFK